MQQLINVCGLPQGRFETIDQPNAAVTTNCFNCDAAQLLCCNPDLVLQRYRWIVETHGVKFDLSYINPNCDLPDVPVTITDLIIKSEKKAVSELSAVREQLQKAVEALRLVDKRIAIHQQQLGWTQEEVDRGENTADRLLLAELELQISLADRQQLIGQIQIIKTTYSYHVGNLLAKLNIQFPDFWLAKIPEFCSKLSASGSCSGSGSGCTQTVQHAVVHPIEPVGIIEYVEPMRNNDQGGTELLLDTIEDSDLLPSVQAIE